MNKAMLLKQYMMSYIRKSEPALEPTSALVYTLSDDGSYYIVGTGFTSLSSIESDTSGGNAGSGLDSTWSGGDLVIPSRYNGKPVLAIAPKSFLDINNITNIYVQNGITHIGQRAFQIANVTDTTTEYAEIPNSVTYFGGISGRVFWHRSFKSVKIGYGVTRIEVSSFNGCSSLTSITIPDGVTSIEEYAFAECRSLTSITIPDGVTRIGDYAFFGCGLTSITIPEAVTSIGNYALCECRSLTSITIPDSVTSIGSKALSYCTKATSITFGSGLTSIGSNALTHTESCNLYDFRKATSVPTLSNASNFNYTPSSKKIVVPDSLYDEWITATNWSSTTNNIVSSIIKASDYEASL